MTPEFNPESPENLLYPLKKRLEALYPGSLFEIDACKPPYVGGYLDSHIQEHVIIFKWSPDRGFSGAHDDTLCWDHMEIWQQDMDGILRYVEEVLAGTWVFPGYGSPKVWPPR